MGNSLALALLARFAVSKAGIEEHLRCDHHVPDAGGAGTVDTPLPEHSVSAVTGAALAAAHAKFRGVLARKRLSIGHGLALVETFCIRQGERKSGSNCHSK